MFKQLENFVLHDLKIFFCVFETKICDQTMLFYMQLKSTKIKKNCMCMAFCSVYFEIIFLFYFSHSWE